MAAVPVMQGVVNLKKVYQIDEEEHTEYIYLKAMHKSLDDHNKLEKVTTLMCDNCYCPWDVHRQEADRECSHMICMQCKKVCVEDVCDIK